MVTFRNIFTGRESSVEFIESIEELDIYMSEHDMDIFDCYEVYADFLEED